MSCRTWKKLAENLRPGDLVATTPSGDQFTHLVRSVDVIDRYTGEERKRLVTVRFTSGAVVTYPDGYEVLVAIPTTTE